MAGCVRLSDQIPEARSRVTFRRPTPAEVGTAAALCWLNERNEGHIARALGTNRRTLARWKQRPEYEAAAVAAQLAWDAEFRERNVKEEQRIREAPDRQQAWHERYINQFMRQRAHRRRP